MEYNTYVIKHLPLQAGGSFPNATLAYKTYGKLNDNGDNVVVLPTFFTGNHIRNEGYLGEGRALDPNKYFIVSINLFGNGLSSSPSNTPAPYGGSRFPSVTLFDNVLAQHTLLTELFGVEEIALVAGWSMAGCQSFQWGAQYPDMVKNILPFCGSAKTSIHNFVFLEGVKAALQADEKFNHGNYTSPPEKGLKAFARVYAGWAYSQTFFREQWFRKLGFDSAEAMLVDWEKDHLEWDANNPLCKLKSWQMADISANDLYGNDFRQALGAIKAKTIVIPCDNDLYFTPEDNEIEVRHIPNADLRVYRSPWGHCVASPGNDSGFARFLDTAIDDLLA